MNQTEENRILTDGEKGNVLGKKGTAGRKYRTPLGYRE